MDPNISKKIQGGGISGIDLFISIIVLNRRGVGVGSPACSQDPEQKFQRIAMVSQVEK